jgi:hypothetical protein
MPKTRGTGLLMAWTDVDPSHEDEFNRWYDEEHIGRLLDVPGFLSAGRYRALRGGPKYLAMYELEDHNVLRSAAFIDTVRYQPSARRLVTLPDRSRRHPRPPFRRDRGATKISHRLRVRKPRRSGHQRMDGDAGVQSMEPPRARRDASR